MIKKMQCNKVLLVAVLVLATRDKDLRRLLKGAARHLKEGCANDGTSDEEDDYDAPRRHKCKARGA